MDFNAYSTIELASEGVWFTPRKPKTDEPDVFSLKLLGTQSDAVKAVDRRLSAVMMENRSKGRNANTEKEIRAFETAKAEKALAATVDWRGSDLGEFSKEKMKEAYAKANLLVDQVIEFLADDENFIKGSATN